MFRRITAVAALMVVASACTGGGETDDRSATTASPGTASSTSTTPTTTAPTTTTGGASTTTVGAPAAAAGSWTFLVYLMGDTDLEPFAVQDLLEMSGAADAGDVNVVALVDRHPAYTDEGVLNLPDWQDTKMLEVRDGALIEIAGDAELNLGSADVLAAFIEAGVSSYPADRYALIFWDHGAGWPGMGPDETDGLDILDLADISDGLARGLEAAGLDSIDLVGFDACLMSTYEVANVVAEHADFMVASQELEPGHGWNYESLSVFGEDDDVTPDELGRAIIDGFAAQAEASGTGADITLSLLDLSAITDFTTALSAVTGPLIADPGEAATLLAGARRGLLGFGRNPDPQQDTNLVDLGGLLDNLAAIGGDSDVGTAAAVALDALEAMVVANTTGPANRQATGLSIYFPEIQDYFRQGYLFIEGDPQWANTLSGFYQAGGQLPLDRQATFVQDTINEPVFFYDDDGLNVFGPMSEFAIGSVIKATMFLGVIEEDSDVQVLYAEEWMDIYTEPVTITDTDGTVVIDESPGVFAITDLTYLQLSDGEDEAVAYYALNVDEETGYGLVDIPLAYVAPGSEEQQDIVLSLVVDLDADGIIEEDFYTVDESGTYGALSADPEGLIFPAVLVVDPDGNSEWTTTTDVGLWADLPNLQYELIPHDPGTQLYVDLTVWDFGGNNDSAVLLPVVP